MVESNKFKEVCWVTQNNPTSPNFYTKYHIVKEGRMVCLCNQPIPAWVKLYQVKFTELTIKVLENPAQALADEIADREKGRNSWDSGVYCKKCLKKLIKMQEVKK